MARAVHVSMMDYDWATSTLNFTQRVIGLQQLCAWAIPQNNNDQDPLHIVLAPEYTFRRSPAAVVRRPSDTYHGGTRTPEETFDAFRESREKSTMYTRADKDLLLFHMCASTRSKNVLVVPGTIFWEETAPVFRTSSVLRQQRLVTKGVARNTAYVIHRGQVIETYHKQTPSHEFDSFEEEHYDFKAGATPSSFDVEGLTTGLEICADHTSGTSLRVDQIARNNPNMTHEERWGHNRLTTPGADGTETEFGLDLQLVVSDGMPIERPRLAVRKGGFVAHCDTRLPKTVQKRADNNMLQAANSPSHNKWEFVYDATSSFQSAAASLARNLQFRT